MCVGGSTQTFQFKDLKLVRAVFFPVITAHLKLLFLHLTEAIIEKDFCRSMKSPLDERAVHQFVLINSRLSLLFCP